MTKRRCPKCGSEDVFVIREEVTRDPATLGKARTIGYMLHCKKCRGAFELGQMRERSQ